MANLPPHDCPGCGAAQKTNPRYPLSYCKTCVKSACDAEGRIISFGNASLSGGLEWSFENEDGFHTGVAALCLINDRPVLVKEAYFGGIVAEPKNLSAPPQRGLVDLRNR